VEDSFDIWKILAGVAIFLLGMNFLEGSLKQLAGRRFKLFLRKQTSNKAKAITGGAIVTGVLQSSSVVNLMVLAFVGAGIINLQNALAIALGSNFGTTLDSWIVATVGFKLSLESFAFPLTAASGIMYALAKKDTKWHDWSGFFLGIGFLFTGLDFMKTGMESWVRDFDIQSFNRSPLIVFLAVGLIVTTLIQSSSATIALTLTALHAGAISFPQSVAIVLGSEVGTTIKFLLASVKGNEVKKRVAAGNFLINTVTSLIVFLFIYQLIHLIKDLLSVKDDVIALVCFQSLTNLISIFLFLPLLNWLSKFLESRFKKTEQITSFIQNAPVSVAELPWMRSDKNQKTLPKRLPYFAQIVSILT
jgi:phosphate:Na+ symporter